MLGHRVTPEPSDFPLRQVTGRACSSLTRFAAVMARRNVVLHDTHLDSVCAEGSKGGLHRTSSTMGRSHGRVLRALGGRNLRATFRKRGTRPWLPTETVPLAILTCQCDIVATYVF